MFYFDKALQIATKKGLHNLKAQALHDIGLQLNREGNYNEAFAHLLKANYQMKDYGYANYPAIARYLCELGEVYWQFGDYEKSRKFLEEAERFSAPNATYGIKISNTLGLCNRELGDLVAAKENFINTIALAKKVGARAWIGIGTGNLGSIYFKLKQYDDAIPLLNVDYNLSLQSREHQSAFTTLCMLAEIYLTKNNINSAGVFLKKATNLLGIVNDPINYRSYYFAQAGYYKLNNAYQQAFRCLDSANYYSRLLTKRDLANIKSKAEQKAAVEKYFSDIELIESRQKIAVITRNAIIGALILFLIITILIVRNLWWRRRNDKQKLVNATEQLNLYVESIKEKTNLIQQFEDKLKSIDLQSRQSENIAELQNYTILTENDWNEFKRLFEKAHSNFFVKLKQRYPGLTQSEVRLMALIKLNLGKKEMADMLGISPDSVKKTRQRIKKKISPEENADLEEIAFSI